MPDTPTPTPTRMPNEVLRLRCQHEGCGDLVMHADYVPDPDSACRSDGGTTVVCTRGTHGCTERHRRPRFWCEAHTPWSGHFEDCPDPCLAVLEEEEKKLLTRPGVTVLSGWAIRAQGLLRPEPAPLPAWANPLVHVPASDGDSLGLARHTTRLKEVANGLGHEAVRIARQYEAQIDALKKELDETRMQLREAREYTASTNVNQLLAEAIAQRDEARAHMNRLLADKNEAIAQRDEARRVRDQYRAEAGEANAQLVRERERFESDLTIAQRVLDEHLGRVAAGPGLMETDAIERDDAATAFHNDLKRRAREVADALLREARAISPQAEVALVVRISNEDKTRMSTAARCTHSPNSARLAFLAFSKASDGEFERKV